MSKRYRKDTRSSNHQVCVLNLEFDGRRQDSCPLPTEIVEVILSYAHLVDIIKVSRCCKWFYQMIRDSHLLQRYQGHVFPDYTSPTVIGTKDVEIEDNLFSIVGWLNIQEEMKNPQNGHYYGMIVSKDRCGIASDQFRLELHNSRRIAFFGLGIPVEYQPSDNRSRDLSYWGSELCSDRAIPLDTWTHFSFVRRKHRAQLFLNGKKCGEVYMHHFDRHTNELELRVGSRYGPTGDGPCNTFPGFLKKVMFLPVALTEEDVKRMYELKTDAYCLIGTSQKARIL